MCFFYNYFDPPCTAQKGEYESSAEYQITTREADEFVELLPHERRPVPRTPLLASTMHSIRCFAHECSHTSCLSKNRVAEGDNKSGDKRQARRGRKCNVKEQNAKKRRGEEVKKFVATIFYYTIW